MAVAGISAPFTPNVRADACPAWSTEFQTGDFNGTVRSLFEFGGDLWVSGYFQSVGGTTAVGLARWTQSHWTSAAQDISRGRYVEASVPFQGRLALAGYNLVTSNQSNQLVIAGDSSWTSIPLPHAFHVNALAVNGPVLVAAQSNDYQIHSGQVAVWDGTSLNFLPPPRGDVTGLAVFKEQIYCAGGPFDAERLGPSIEIIAWDGKEWQDAGYRGLGPTDMLSLNERLYVSGYRYPQTDDSATVRVFDGETWSELPSQSPGGYITTLGSFRGRLVAAGNFESMGGAPARGIASFDGAQWHAMGEGVSTHGAGGYIMALLEWNSQLIVAGTFTAAGGERANNIARWDGENWSRFSDVGNGVIGGATNVVVRNHIPLVGGWFTAAGNIECNGLAEWDGESWHPVTADVPTTVTRLIQTSEDLYALGAFQTGAPYEPYQDTVLARVVNNRCEPIFGLYGYADRAVALGRSVAVAGYFLDEWGDYREFAVWDGNAWQFPPLGPLDRVREMTEYRGVLVAEVFREANPVRQLETWDGAEWKRFSGLPPVGIASLRCSGDALYALGEAGVFRWDGRWWNYLPLPSSAYGNFELLFPFHGSILAYGTFYLPDVGPKSSSKSILQWDGTRWNYFAGPFDADVKDVATVENGGRLSLYIVGDFSNAGGGPSNSIARLDTCTCVADVNGDSQVDGRDLSVFLARFGRQSGNPYELGDLNGDRLINGIDLAVLLSSYQDPCP